MFKGTKYESKINRIEIENKLKRDIIVTHRTLHHISIEAKYCAFDMIKLLNIHVNEDDSGEGLAEKIVKIKDNLDKFVGKKNAGTDLLKNKKSAHMDDKKIIIPPIIKNFPKDMTGIHKCEYCRGEFGDENAFDTHLCVEESDIKGPNNKILTYGGVNVMTDYQKLWKDTYTSKETLSGQQKTEITRKIKFFLDECERVDERGKQISVVVELFDYLANEGYLMMNHPGFFSGVGNKIEEFYHKAPELFQLLNPNTKQFIYAASGIKCD